jgi:hypothetical protein
LGKLVSKTYINIHTFLNLKYGTSINVTFAIQKITCQSVLVESLNNSISLLSEHINELEVENIFIKNTFRNIDKDLYVFLQKPAVVIPKYSDCNWSKMTPEQHTECIITFSKVHFEKYPNGNLDKLSTQLVEWYTTKKLVYRNIKWNKIQGKITEIRGLVYDKTTDFYTLRKQTSSSTTSNKLTIDKVKLNNELLQYIIIQKKKYAKLDDVKFDKTHFFNHMKIKLETTLGKDTKIELLNKLNEMYNCLVTSD